jgi:hypothetical protein
MLSAGGGQDTLMAKRLDRVAEENGECFGTGGASHPAWPVTVRTARTSWAAQGSNDSQSTGDIHIGNYVDSPVQLRVAALSHRRRWKIGRKPKRLRGTPRGGRARIPAVRQWRLAVVVVITKPCNDLQGAGSRHPHIFL